MRALRRHLTHLLRPIAHEWIFFLTFYLIISQTALKTIRTVWNDPESWWMLLEWLSLAFVWAYVVTLLITIAHSKWVKAGGYVVAVALWMVYLFLWLEFHIQMSPTVMQTLGETNATEASEFVSVFLTSRGSLLSLSITAAVIVWIIIAEHKRLSMLAWLRRRRQLMMPAAIAVLCLSIIGIAKCRIFLSLMQCRNTADIERWCEQQNPVFPMDMVSATLYSVKAVNVCSHDIADAVKLAKHVAAQPAYCDESDSLTVIFILGESYIKRHCPLYSYPLMTTPHMAAEQQEGRLVALTDVVSPYNATVYAEKNVFCCNSVARGEEWYRAAFFPTVFRAARFNVYMWDMQHKLDKGDTFTYSVNALLYNPDIQRLSYTATNDREFDYDGELVEDFLGRYGSRRERSLVIFHLMGQHLDAAQRFPHEPRYIYFTADSIRRTDSYLTPTMRREIADYDNATRYNDEVVGRIIDAYRHRDAVLVYLSDHGEEIYDYRPSKGRKGDPEHPSEMRAWQYEIPCFIWCSDRYVRHHPGITAQIRKVADRHYSSDIVAHLLFRLAGIKTSEYRPTCDILSDSYETKTLNLKP